MKKVEGLFAIVAPLALVASCSAAPSSSPADLGTWTPGTAPSTSGSVGPTTGPTSGSSGSSGSVSNTGASGNGGPSGSAATGASPASGDPLGGSGAASGSASSGAAADAGVVVTTAGPVGLPCDVAAVLSSKCTACHSNPPVKNSLSALVTHADLLATAKEDPSKNEAQLSLSRMQNTASPMPPLSFMQPATASEVAILSNWVNAGYPTGACGADAGAPADAGPAVVAVNVFQGALFKAGTGSSSHNAGRDCMSCHAGGGDAPRFSLGGTLYDGKGSPVGGAEVRVVDKNGATISVYTGANGTFHSSTSFTAPAHVGARNATSELNMVSLLSYGGCSKCHGSGTGATTSQVHVP